MSAMVTDAAERIMYLVTLLHYVASFVAGMTGIMWRASPPTPPVGPV